MRRCLWAGNAGPEMVRYHDEEWGVPVCDDRGLFEMLCLGGAQAGLSWSTVLNKRPAYRALFHGFDIHKCARMTDGQLAEILRNPAIIRNRLKVFSVRNNARAALAVAGDHGSLSGYLWGFVGQEPIVNRIGTMSEIPAASPESDAMSRSLKSSGFSFVGSTICYAFMQAVGMVNDHETGCFRYAELVSGTKR
ncbi:MAG: DNA-3-methyladenine glycosylase I [bacterium]|nr:MAG: DNA-3-methyladenine glycosylase I [bacterium]